MFRRYYTAMAAGQKGSRPGREGGRMECDVCRHDGSIGKLRKVLEHLEMVVDELPHPVAVVRMSASRVSGDAVGLGVKTLAEDPWKTGHDDVLDDGAHPVRKLAPNPRRYPRR